MKPQSPSPKIFAFHAGGIGDLILALPALRAFREFYSDSSLELMGYRERLSLIAHDLKARSLHSVDRSGMALFYSQGETLPSRLVDLFSSFAVALVLGQSRAETLAENLRRAGLQKVTVVSSFPPEGQKKHVSEFLLEALRASGLQGSDLFRPLSLPTETELFADEFLNKTGWPGGMPILAIHPGSGSPSKNWSPEHFARIADWACDHGSIFLVSGPAQDGRDEFLQAVRKANPVILENMPLLSLASVLRKCTVYLGNDSGITHLAAVLGIPTFALFGPTDPTIWGPRGAKVQIITAEEQGARLSTETGRQSLLSSMDEIKPEKVLKKLAPTLVG